MEWTGDGKGPTHRKRYIQARSICVEWRGVKLTVDAHEYGQSGHGIMLQWEGTHRTDQVAFVPHSFQSAKLVSKQDMR